MPKLETLPEMVLTTADIKEGDKMGLKACPVAHCLRTLSNCFRHSRGYICMDRFC